MELATELRKGHSGLIEIEQAIARAGKDECTAALDLQRKTLGREVKLLQIQMRIRETEGQVVKMSRKMRRVQDKLSQEYRDLKDRKTRLEILNIDHQKELLALMSSSTK